MNYYQIKDVLTESDESAVQDRKYPYVALLNVEEYRQVRDIFGMEIDIEQDFSRTLNTKVVVNYDCLTGSIDIPRMPNRLPVNRHLAFALDGHGIVFIDNDDYTLNILNRIQESRRWRFPSLERFIYDFLEETIAPDLDYLNGLENELEKIEERIMNGEIEEYPPRFNTIRSGLLEMHTHYMHLMDLAKELEENENEYFSDENLRFFRLFGERTARLQDSVTELREYIVQLRDLVSEQLGIRQNHIMTLLTVITTIFMPLTLIVGWYGMNFVNMPELYSPWGYPVVIIVSVVIVVISLFWFRRKRWL
ncbi:MAG: hypothetical protein IJI33_09625 [Solobacterium sp.]|jgi:magnesium transporter|nr:hypothetical protein [Solobacterium sp.]MBR0214918.1 hypothetical protein [Solobacterium sp.]